MVNSAASTKDESVMSLARGRGPLGERNGFEPASGGPRREKRVPVATLTNVGVGASGEVARPKIADESQHFDAAKPGEQNGDVLKSAWSNGLASVKWECRSLEWIRTPTA